MFFRTQQEIRRRENQKLECKLLHEEVDVLVNLEAVQVVCITLRDKCSGSIKMLTLPGVS